MVKPQLFGCGSCTPLWVLPLGDATIKIIIFSVDVSVKPEHSDDAMKNEKETGLRFETREVTTVFLAGKKIGEIRESDQGFAYYPKGCKDRGEFFPTRQRCIQSLY